MIKFVAKYSVEGVENASMEECVSFLKKLDIIGIDIETSVNEQFRHLQNDVYKGGLDPYLSSIVMLQLGDIANQYVIDVRDFTVEELAPILKLLNYNPNIVLVGHNLKFEAKHLKHKYGINFHTIWDTMLCEITLYNGLNYPMGLANLASRYFGINKKIELSLFADYHKKNVVTLDDELLAENEYAITPFEVESTYQMDKSTRMQFINIASKPFTKEQILYGADDIIYPLLIKERQQVGRRLDDGVLHNPKNWQKVENNYCLVLADLELNGMAVRADKWLALHEKNYAIYKEREEKLSNYILATYPQYSSGTLDLFTGKQVCFIQWTSATQVANLYKSLGICPRAYSKHTKKVEFTVGATELTRKLPNNLKVLYERNTDTPIVDLDTFTLAYLLFKKSEQAITTFGKDWLKYIHPITKRAHSNYRQILNTTRISSSNPNLNNISGGEWRECFEVADTHVLVNADAANQEVRVLSSKSGDEALISFFVNGDDYFKNDFHSYTATKVYKILENNPDLIVPPKEILVDGVIAKNPLFTSEDGNRRTDSKGITFGLAFGKSLYTFALDLGIDIEETELLLKSYFDAFPGLKDHFDRCEKQADKNSYIIIDEHTGAAWFCPFFPEIEKLYKEAWSHFPDSYKDLKYKDKVSFKTQLYKEKPFVKVLFQKAGRLKNALINKNKNYIIQGTCAQMLKIAMCIFRRHILDKKLPFLLVGNIYDEVLVEVEEKYKDKAGKLVKYSMEKAGATLDAIVPQVSEYVISKTWKH